MDKYQLSERDICTKFITSALEKAGWDIETQVREEFAPYTSIATNVLLFEKGEPTKDLWFFEHPYPGGYKSYSRSKPLDIKEFDLEKTWWGGPTRRGRKTTENAWEIFAADISARNYNLDCKNPHALAVNKQTAHLPEQHIAAATGKQAELLNAVMAQMQEAA